MTRYLLVLSLLFASSVAQTACAQNATAWVRCDVAAGELVVVYEPGDGGAPYDGPADHVVEFDDLLDLDETGSRVVGTRDAQFECRLGGDVLAVVLSPMPGNANLLGSCGGEVGGMLNVSRDGVDVVDGFEFEPGECHAREEYARKLMLRAGARDYQVERRRYDPGR